MWEPPKVSVYNCYNSFINQYPSIGAGQGLRFSKSMGDDGGLSLSDWRIALHDAVSDATKTSGKTMSELTSGLVTDVLTKMYAGKPPKKTVAIMNQVTDCGANNMLAFLLSDGPSDPQSGLEHFQGVHNVASMLTEPEVSDDHSAASGRLLNAIFTPPGGCGGSTPPTSGSTPPTSKKTQKTPIDSDTTAPGGLAPPKPKKKQSIMLGIIVAAILIVCVVIGVSYYSKKPKARADMSGALPP